MEACPISSQQPTHERGREEDTKIEIEKPSYSNVAFDFIFILTLDFTLYLPGILAL